MHWNFDYGHANIRDFQAIGQRDEKTGRSAATRMEIAGRQVQPTKRFWKSLFMRFGFGDNVFRYFDHGEVFDRISQRNADDRVRWCIAKGETGEEKLLAVSSPKRPLITYGEVTGLVGRYDGRDVQYHDGVVTSTHVPRSGQHPLAIGADTFQHRYVMETPVDGFSHPKIYLSLLRLLCSNGAIGYVRTFRSDVSLGKDIAHCISRALDSYDNEEGYAALRQRFESAQTSWASVRECRTLTALLEKVGLTGGATKEHLRRQFFKITGDLHQLYGLANLDALSNKRQRVLPSRCRVYDLLNFASEVGTHHSTPAGNQALQAFVGATVADEFDLEGTATTGKEFADLFVAM